MTTAAVPACSVRAMDELQGPEKELDFAYRVSQKLRLVGVSKLFFLLLFFFFFLRIT